MKDYYGILEVPPSASHIQIRDQYRLLLHAWHPDKFSTPTQKEKALERTKQINEAYAVLGEAAKRAAYDRDRSREAADSRGAQEQQRADQNRRAADDTARARQQSEREARQRAQARADSEARSRRRRRIATGAIMFGVIAAAATGLAWPLFGIGLDHPTPVPSPTTTVAVGTALPARTATPTMAPTATPTTVVMIDEDEALAIVLRLSDTGQAEEVWFGGLDDNTVYGSVAKQAGAESGIMYAFVGGQAEPDLLPFIISFVAWFQYPDTASGSLSSLTEAVWKSKVVAADEVTACAGLGENCTQVTYHQNNDAVHTESIAYIWRYSNVVMLLEYTDHLGDFEGVTARALAETMQSRLP